MNIFFKELIEHNIISREEENNIKHKIDIQPVVLHFELLSCLYIGILMFVGGISMLVYKNIDRIGHLAVIIILMLTCIGCFYYALRNSKPFSINKVEQKNTLFDYVVLLACLLLPVVLGYLQFQYHIVGDHISLVSLVCSILLFACAYYFDHTGILGLAITALASWFGLSITPLNLLKNFDYDSTQLTIVAMFFGLMLYGLSLLTIRNKIKIHFSETYKNIGIHLFFISGCFLIWKYGFWFYPLCVGLIGLSYLMLNDAISKKNFYYFAVALIYGYFYLIALVIKIGFLVQMNEAGILLITFIVPAIAGSFVYLLIKYYKQLK